MTPSSTSKTEPLRARLDAWLAGELPAAAEGELFAALAAEPALAEEAEEAEALRQIVVGLRTLPETIEPESDLWPGIAARVRASGELSRRRVRLRRIAALAAALVAALGATTAWLAQRDTPPRPQPLVAVAAAPPGTQLTLAAYAATDQALGAIGDELRREIEARQEKLPPETRALVFENLRTIDRALAEIEAALRETPADPDLARTYIAYRERQIDVLRQANRMAARL